MPSTSSSSIPKVFDSSTVMTPSLPTLSMASATTSPISRVVVRGDRSDVGDLLAALDVTGLRLDRVDRGSSGLLDAALQRHRVGAGCDLLRAGVHHRLSENRRGGRAVTGDVVRLRSDFLDELRAEVLPRVFELDLFGDRYTVVRDRRCSPLLVEDHVATLGTERHAHGIGQAVDPVLEAAPGFGVVPHFLSWHPLLLFVGGVGT